MPTSKLAGIRRYRPELSLFKVPGLGVLRPCPERAVLILHRKEVIQPQVPLRLPCYDFIPVTSCALGPCFPCGLTRILRARPASMM